tara:strand:- start:21946 stop:22401 length:456 start_codon:yes stop_codon:yes gene_type:complete
MKNAKQKLMGMLICFGMGFGTQGFAQIDYEKTSDGTRLLGAPSGTEILMLVEAQNLGSGEVEIGQITFPAGVGTDVSEHRHGSIEFFYVMEGVLEHIVNGQSYMLEPGMIGIVRPQDSVAHRVPGNEPVKALVIWAPGGEADRLGFTQLEH